MKCSDEFTVPLNPRMHDMADGRQDLPNGEVGKEAFERFFHVDLLEQARICHEGWMAKVGRKVA